MFQNKVCKVEGGLPTALRVRVCEQGRGRAGGQEGGMDGGREFFIEEENRTRGLEQTGKREETVTP